MNGGDDRIRTCGSLLDYNDLANRRFQPLSHVSICLVRQNSILAVEQTLSSFPHRKITERPDSRLDRLDFCGQNTKVTSFTVFDALFDKDKTTLTIDLDAADDHRRRLYFRTRGRR